MNKDVLWWDTYQLIIKLMGYWLPVTGSYPVNNLLNLVNSFLGDAQIIIAITVRMGLSIPVSGIRLTIEHQWLTCKKKKEIKEKSIFMVMNSPSKLKLHLATFGNAAMTSCPISVHPDRVLSENLTLCCAEGLRFAVSWNREKQQIVTVHGHPNLRSRSAGGQ